MRNTQENSIGFYVWDLYPRCYIPSITISYDISQRIKDCEEPIAELLEIPISEYNKLMQKYGAHPDKEMGLIFLYHSDAQAFVDHLNDKYLVMLRLNGKIS